MARIAWSVDGHRIEYLGRPALLKPGGLLVDGVKDEECRIKFSRPDYEFPLGRRRLELRSVGETAELWSRGLLIPPSAAHVPVQRAPDGAGCPTHTNVPATITCARCGAFACAQCEGPDGTHCLSCVSGSAPTATDVEAGPAAALALFGGGLGKAIAAADSQLEKHVASPGRRRWVRLVVYGTIALALLVLIASKAPRS